MTTLADIQSRVGVPADGKIGPVTLAAIAKALGMGAATLTTHRLGAISEVFESGGMGPGTVSSGAGDPGGVSYGIWQLASKTGTAAAFVGSEGAPWRAEFGGAVPASAAFTAAWKRIAAREPGRFAEAQHAFIKRSHYDPAVKAVRASTSLDIDACHPAVRDVAWSVAVQHGGAARILAEAVGKVDAMMKRNDPRYATALINAIYDVRTAYVLGVGARSGSQTTLKTMQGIAKGRYVTERQAALAALS
jgi:hypothetical protein